MEAVLLPVLGANMSEGVVRRWFKREGDPVEIGEPLFEVETDKVNAEVEAEAAGVLRKIVADAGACVPVLGVVGFIGAVEEPVPDPAEWQAPAAGAAGEEVVPPVTATAPAEPAVAAPGRAGRVKASPAARRLARERGLELATIPASGPRGEVTRADVEAASRGGSAAGGAARGGEETGEGKLDAVFLDRIRRDVEAFRALSSEVKVDLYRRHGALIGDHVRIERGAIVLAERIEIGAASSVGEDSRIECESFRLGRLSAFGKGTRIRCRVASFGDALWSKDNVVIGGGGSHEPGAVIEIGDAAFIGGGAYLNPGHPIRLGDEVCIGARAMLFTHSHWQSILRGYASVFGPIEVGDHVFIGNNAFVFPGVSIGSGVTVIVNSFVALNVPANTMVGGVPAQVIRHITAPSREEQVRLFRARLPELAAALEAENYTVKVREEADAVTLDLGRDGCVHFTPAWPARTPERERLIVLSFCDGDTEVPAGATLFDLAGVRVIGKQGRLSDEVREFCRRRGIRFRPFAWRYRTGHFVGDRFVSGCCGTGGRRGTVGSDRLDPPTLQTAT